MKMFGLGMLIVAAAQSQASPPATPIPVQIIGAPQEKMARELDEAVRKKFQADPRFVLTNNSPGAGLIIAMPEGIGWERRLDWTEIHFQARVSSPSGRTQVVAGHCWNWNLGECGKWLTEAAAKFAAGQ
jgi:hypothetical protein